ncbi:acyltransferase [Chloroflexota bacterium]
MKLIKKIYRRIFKKHRKHKSGYSDWTKGVEYARSKGVKVGEDCRCLTKHFGSEPYLISLGDHVSVADDVHFITHDGGLWVFREEVPADYIRPIIVHRNSIIGSCAIILPGVEIGPNSVVGAGSVVTRRVPPNSVAAGVPARVISTLDDYRSRIKDDMLINNLSPEEKNVYLLNYFGTTVEEWLGKMEGLDRDT